jgi:hypothetical protein
MGPAHRPLLFHSEPNSVVEQPAAPGLGTTERPYAWISGGVPPLLSRARSVIAGVGPAPMRPASPVPKEGSQVKGSLKLPNGLRWPVGSALLILALAGQAVAASSITGTVKFPGDEFREGSKVAATSDKFDAYRADVADDGTFAIDDVAAGTYTIAVISPGFTAPDVTNVVVKDGEAVKQDFTLKEMEPVCIVKSPTRIPLTDDINSASFADAPDIVLNSAKNLGVGETAEWSRLGGPNVVSGRFKLKYSDYGFHLAGDLTFKTPLVNNQDAQNAWNGNALEFAYHNLPYDPTLSGADTQNHWKLQVGLGEQENWWEDSASKMDPTEKIAQNMVRKQKELKDGVGGETFRLDIPWSIFHKGDASGEALTVPEDNALAALDIILGAADPEAERSEATRKFQLQWTGFGDSHWNSNHLMPVKFCPQPPPTAGS